MQTIKISLLKFFLSTFAFSLALLGCGGSDDNQTLISEFDFTDNGLKECVIETASANNWQLIDDINELNCRLEGKARAAASADYLTDKKTIGIVETNDLSQFKNLKQLSLIGHLFSNIDVSKLHKLEYLNLSSSFVSQLDLSNNKELKYLNVSSTAISTLDLSHLSLLETLIATSNPESSDQYQFIVLEGNERVYGTSIAEVEQSPRTIQFNDSSPLVNITVDRGFELNPPNTQALAVVQGLVSSELLMSAPRLKKVLVTVSDTTTDLDFSHAANLEELDLTAPNITDFTLGKNVKTVTINADLQKLFIPEESLLEELTINTVSNTTVQATGFGFQEYLVNATQLKNLHISGFFLGRLFDLSTNTQLQSLTLDNADVDISLALPPNLKNLTLIDQRLNPRISPREIGLESLYLTNVAPDRCRLYNQHYPLLKNLFINNCDMSDINLEAAPNLTELFISTAPITSLNLGDTPNVNRLGLANTNLEEVDFSPLDSAIDREYFFFSSSILEFDDLDIITTEAVDYFSSVFVSGAPAP